MKRIFSDAQQSWAARWAKAHPAGLPHNYGKDAFGAFRKVFPHTTHVTALQVTGLVSREADRAGIPLTRRRSGAQHRQADGVAKANHRLAEVR